MSERPVVVALGRILSGDDGVGPAVVDELRRRGLDAQADLHRLADPTELIPLIQEGRPVVLVDAVQAEPAGCVMDVTLDQLSRPGVQMLSSHGLTVPEAVRLAGVLHPGADASTSLSIVGIAIDARHCIGEALSPEVAAAVPRATARVLELLEELR